MGAAYTYFGQLRIKKTKSDGTTVYIYSGNKPIAEYAPGAALTSPSKEYVYAGSQLLASIAGTNMTYYHPDHLSNRTETDSSGNVTRRMGHFPFGESWYDSTPQEKWNFTSTQHSGSTPEPHKRPGRCNGAKKQRGVERAFLEVGFLGRRANQCSLLR